MSHRKDHDIKAPDGYTLGGLRLVRKDGSILFGRGWWQAPSDWVGEKVWVHEEWSYQNGPHMFLEAAEPGLHIYEARSLGRVHRCEPIDRPDAKPVFRTADHKAWKGRSARRRVTR